MAAIFVHYSVFLIIILPQYFDILLELFHFKHFEIKHASTIILWL